MKYLMKSKGFTKSKTFIKTYEDLEHYYTINEIIDIPYWRLKHATMDSVFKINKITREYSWKNNFDITIYNLDTNKFKNVDCLDDDDIMMKIFNLNDGRLIRPATKEEIEQFDLAEKTKKYNIF